MNALKFCKTTSYHSLFLYKHSTYTQIKNPNAIIISRRRTKLFELRASVDGQEDRNRSERRSFLTLEEAGLVEMSGLSSHEAFLCRLTVIFTRGLRFKNSIVTYLAVIRKRVRKDHEPKHVYSFYLLISSLNLLRVIGEQEECSIEELNAGKVCDWFLKDKLKGEQNLDAVLQWNESDFQL